MKTIMEYPGELSLISDPQGPHVHMEGLYWCGSHLCSRAELINQYISLVH